MAKLYKSIPPCLHCGSETSIHGEFLVCNGDCATRGLVGVGRVSEVCDGYEVVWFLSTLEKAQKSFAIIPELCGSYGPRILVNASEINWSDRMFLNDRSVWGGPDKREGDMLGWEFPIAYKEGFRATCAGMMARGFVKVEVDQIWK
jgi:hypothetical protein